MKRFALWETLSRRLGSKRARWPAIGLQPVGLWPRDIAALRPVLEKLSDRLAVNFELRDDAAEIVLLDADYAVSSAPQILHALKENRPSVLTTGFGDDERLLSVAQYFERCQQELLRQLKEIPLVRAQSARWSATGWDLEVLTDHNCPSVPDSDSDFTSAFDSELDADQLAAEPLDCAQKDFVQRVLYGLHHQNAQPLGASYDQFACMRFEFRARFVTIDPKAQQMLRVWRELPLVLPDAQPSPEANGYELNETIWHLGVACGRYALLNQPEDWWHTPLRSLGRRAAELERYTRQPRHLELGRLLIGSPITPSEMRRHVRIGIPDLRCFLQACLFLRLVCWSN